MSGVDHKLGGSDDVTLAGVSSASATRISTGSSSHVHRSAGAEVFPPGTVLAGRYEIVQLLGEGGMGAVYKAHDRELDRDVALKMILPELANDPGALQRFKQEVIPARGITHTNVVRIFDLAESNGLKFITMEYIQGEDLGTVLNRRGKLNFAEAVDIIQQVCAGLQAAHAEGVIHRDLKPGNIMRDAQGRMVLMDFGLARSVESRGMTQTGALVGTMEYMSPEQALGETLDARSDLFTVGLIFYELLTGKRPYKAESAIASLMKRSQERATPPSDVDSAVPRGLSNIVTKCLERDRNQRYQSAAEILEDLEKWAGGRPTSAIVTRKRRLKPAWIVAAVLGIAALGAGIAFRTSILSLVSRQPVATGPALAVAILPFRNASGDTALDWIGSSLPEMLNTDIGQSAELRTVSADRIHQILRDLRIGANTDFDSDTVRRLAGFSNADVVVWGQYVKAGEQVRLDLSLQDLKRQRTVSLKADAANEKALLSTVDQLARSIRENLSLSSSAVKQMQATAFKPSSNSVEALRAYNQGVALTRLGKHLDALKSFQAATQQDPQFALAYSRLGQTYAQLGYDDQAQQTARKALELSQELAAPEKYIIQGNYARTANDIPKAIQAYEDLAKVLPDDTDVLFNLGLLYERDGAFDQARSRIQRVLDKDPKYVDALLAMGRVNIRAGRAQDSLDFLNRALSLAVQLGNDEAKAAILQALGIAYERLNRPDDALGNYQQSLEIKRRIGDKRGMAASLDQLAQVYELQGKLQAALASYNEALQVRRSIGDKTGIGNTLINLGTFYEARGKYDEALRNYKDSLQIQLDLGNKENQALCQNNIGNVYYLKGEYDEALTYHQQALQLREKLGIPADIAQSNHNLAETSAKLGQYDKALSYYLKAIELWRGAGDKRGVAIASNGLGVLFAMQGRYGAALNATQDAVNTSRELQDQPGLADALPEYGNTLALMGRDDEAKKALDEALALARELKSSPLVARTLGYQGDRLLYRGDYSGAKSLYQQALQEATSTRDRIAILNGKLNLARASLGQGRPQTLSSSLKPLLQEASNIHSKYLATEATLLLGQALLATNDLSGARETLSTTVQNAQDLGLRVMTTQAHYLLAQAHRRAGRTADAQRSQTEARRLLDELRKEVGSDSLLKRSDLAPIAASVN